MKPRTTIIMLLIALGLGSYIWFYDRYQASTGQVEREGRRVFRIKADDIERLDISAGDKRIVFAREEDGEWRMTKPLDYGADNAVLKTVCNRLEALGAKRTIPAGEMNAAKEREFGLEKPRIRVRFTAGKRNLELDLGKDTPLGNRLYARAGGTGDVYIVPKAIYNVLDKKPDDFRDRSVIKFDLDRISRAEIRRGGETLKFKREGEKWLVEGPVSGLGNPDKISGALRKVRNLRIRDFITDKPKNLADYGLDKPAYEVVVWDEKGQSSKAVQFGKKKGERQVYARREGSDTVFTVSEWGIKDLAAPAGDFREKKITRLSPSSIRKVAIRRGKERLELVRKGKKWTMSAPEKRDADETDVRALLRKLTGLSAEEFVAEGAKNLDRYGLGAGATVITLTPEEGKPETITIGKTLDRGKAVYLLRGKSNEVVTVASGFLKDVSTDPLAFRKKRIMDFKASDAVRISLSRRGKAPVVCEKVGGKRWKAINPGGAEVREGDINVLLTTLGNLHARRFIASSPSSLKKYGLEKPLLTVAVDVEKAGKKSTEELVVGKKAGKELYYAKRGGETAVFTIPSYMVRNLEKDLVGGTSSPTPEVRGAKGTKKTDG